MCGLTVQILTLEMTTKQSSLEIAVLDIPVISRNSCWRLFIKCFCIYFLCSDCILNACVFYR